MKTIKKVTSKFAKHRNINGVPRDSQNTVTSHYREDMLDRTLSTSIAVLELALETIGNLPFLQTAIGTLLVVLRRIDVWPPSLRALLSHINIVIVNQSKQKEARAARYSYRAASNWYLRANTPVAKRYKVPYRAFR